MNSYGQFRVINSPICKCTSLDGGRWQKALRYGYIFFCICYISGIIVSSARNVGLLASSVLDLLFSPHIGSQCTYKNLRSCNAVFQCILTWIGWARHRLRCSGAGMHTLSFSPKPLFYQCPSDHKLFWKGFWYSWLSSSMSNETHKRWKDICLGLFWC